MIFFEPKSRYWPKGEVDFAESGAPLHASRVVRAGTDVTVVGHGAMVSVLLQAADIAAAEGISIEVVDLRSLSPIDYGPILASVEKTGRVVVAQEAPGFVSLGSEIAATVAERAFYALEAPVLRVSGFDTPFPPAAVETHFLPEPRPRARGRRSRPRLLSMTSPSDPEPQERHTMSVSKFTLPDVGEGLTEAEIVEWKVAPGDTITINQVLVEIETAKSLVELPSPFVGVVGEILVAGRHHRRRRNADHHDPVRATPTPARMPRHRCHVRRLPHRPPPPSSANWRRPPSTRRTRSPASEAKAPGARRTRSSATMPTRRIRHSAPAVAHESMSPPRRCCGTRRRCRPDAAGPPAISVGRCARQAADPQARQRPRRRPQPWSPRPARSVT